MSYIVQTLTLKARTDKDGVIRLEIPTYKADREMEIVLVMQAVDDEPLDEIGYPSGYFEDTYGILADDPIERNQPPYPDVRDKIESKT
jgi:hypothetical protein